VSVQGRYATRDLRPFDARLVCALLCATCLGVTTARADDSEPTTGQEEDTPADTTAGGNPAATPTLGIGTIVLERDGNTESFSLYRHLIRPPTSLERLGLRVRLEDRPGVTDYHVSGRITGSISYRLVDAGKLFNAIFIPSFVTGICLLFPGILGPTIGEDPKAAPLLPLSFILMFGGAAVAGQMSRVNKYSWDIETDLVVRRDGQQIDRIQVHSVQETKKAFTQPVRSFTTEDLWDKTAGELEHVIRTDLESRGTKLAGRPPEPLELPPAEDLPAPVDSAREEDEPEEVDDFQDEVEPVEEAEPPNQGEPEGSASAPDGLEPLEFHGFRPEDEAEPAEDTASAPDGFESLEFHGFQPGDEAEPAEETEPPLRDEPIEEEAVEDDEAEERS